MLEPKHHIIFMFFIKAYRQKALYTLMIYVKV